MAFKIFEASVISFTPTHPILLTAASGFDKESIQDLFEKYLLANFAGQAGIWSGKRRNVTAEADKEYSAHNMDHKMRSQQTEIQNM